ncbi:MAG TPA: DUF302 domain-containing protein [Aggregatilineales bacterium]|nr:DUF302 domain-containing protein [Aggregatilineales bacterium]
MTQPTTTIGMKTILHTTYEDALERTKTALKANGFGVLTEINVKETLKAKIDVDFRPYIILGACNPKLAYRALTASSEIGLMLPCNVTVAQVGEGQMEVAIIDPIAMMTVVEHPDLPAIAQEAKALLQKTLDMLNAG